MLSLWEIKYNVKILKVLCVFQIKLLVLTQSKYIVKKNEVLKKLLFVNEIEKL